MEKVNINNIPKDFIENEDGGSLIEYGLIIGFALVSFIVIIGIVLSVFDWANTTLSDFFSFLG